MEEIREGSRVRYTATGTSGVVKVIREMDGEMWALLDSTGLYYNLSTLEPITHLEEKKGPAELTVDELLDQMKEEKERMTKVKMEDESVESGG